MKFTRLNEKRLSAAEAELDESASRTWQQISLIGLGRRADDLVGGLLWHQYNLLHFSPLVR